MAESVQMRTCPMASTCKGMIENKHSGLFMIIPGILFIAFGFAIIVYPQILAWFIAIALILMGVAMLMMANFMRKIGQRFEPMAH